MEAIFIFLFAFQIKHLIIDFYLQTPYMYENKGQKTGWIEPLLLHSVYHAVGTYLLILVWHLYTQNDMTFYMGYAIAGIDLVSHFIVDRWKATQPEKPDTTKFWTNLGWDQFWHHTFGLIIVYITLSYF